MKKVVVSMMLAGALLTSGTIFAQAKTDGTTGATTQKESVKKCDNGSCDKEKCDKDKEKNKKSKKGDKRQIARPQYNAFDGIQLTEDQQQRLQVLQQGLGPVRLSQEQQERIPENTNLSDDQKKQLREERKAKALESKKNYLNGVKEILTPDQYVIFLENYYLYTPQDQGKGGAMKPVKREHKGEKGRMEKRDKAAKK